MKAYNLNDHVVIYPNKMGWAKMIEIRRRRLPEEMFSLQVVKKELYSHRTREGGYKTQLWELLSEFGELFFNGSPYLHNSYMSFIDKFEEKEINVSQVLDWENIPDYGTLMTLREFIENCLNGDFIDYDGHGCYATENKMSNIVVRPSDIIKYNHPEGLVDPSTMELKRENVKYEFTHVIWFNR